ncbi:MAG: hypothetical protein NC123_08985 [Butyrivibrio sp.]|nr:hypothetical protein [Butyrivibrio sp.]
MSEEFEKRLDFDSDTFEEMKKDMNFVLQRLIGNMQEKGSDEGSMTLKIDVTMVKEFIPNYDPDIKGESREVSKPQFKHKVTSVVKINDEKSGSLNNEMELVMDEDTGVFKLVPIANTAQRSIFDSDFQQQDGKQESRDDDSAGSNAIEGRTVLGLPGPNDEGEVIDGEFREVDSVETDPGEDAAGEPEELDDITDELLGPDDSEDGYGYEEPEDDPEE